jgi:hypothetical protein
MENGDLRGSSIDPSYWVFSNRRMTRDSSSTAMDSQ